MEKDEVIKLVKEVFSEMWPSHFCGCYEGDIGGEYEYGVASFIGSLEEKMAQLTQHAVVTDYCSCPLGDQPTTTLPGNRCGICNKPRR